MKKVSDIESNSSHTASDNEKGKCKYICCLAVILIVFIIVIMATTGEISSKKN